MLTLLPVLLCIYPSLTSHTTHTPQIARDLQLASELLSPTGGRHPHRLLLPQGCGLTYADIALASAINKCSEMWHTALPSSSPADVTTPATGAGAAPSSTAGAPSNATNTTNATTANNSNSSSQRKLTILSFMPHTQRLLEQHPELVQWAAETGSKHWPAGAATVIG